MSILYIKQNISNDIQIADTALIADLAKNKSKSAFKELFDQVKAKYQSKTKLDYDYLFEQTKATHMGYVNKNMSMYPVAIADKSARSWFSPFEKPVLKNHDHLVDPLGRHVHAAYIPFDLNDRQASNIAIPKGVIVTHSIITDRGAMEKVKDGRYLTVSIGARSDAQYCSICGQNWLDIGPWDEDRCEHQPGQRYTIDGKKELCYKKTGVLDYVERSYVNVPADQGGNHFAGVSNYELVCNNEDELKDADYIAKNMIGNKESAYIADSSGYVLSLEPNRYGEYPTSKSQYFFSTQSEPNDESTTSDSAHGQTNIETSESYNGPDEKSVEDNSSDEDVVLMPNLTTSEIDQLSNLDSLPTSSNDTEMINDVGKQHSTRKETNMPELNWEKIPIKDAMDNVPGLVDYVDRIAKQKAETITKDLEAQKEEALKDSLKAKASLESLTEVHDNVLNQAKEIAVDTVMSLLAQLEKPQYVKLTVAHKDDDEGFKEAVNQMRDKIAERELNSLIDTIGDLKDELDSKILIAAGEENQTDEEQTAMDGITKTTDSEVAEDGERLEDSDKEDDDEEKPKTSKSLI